MWSLECVRGMRTLDRSQFALRVTVPVALVEMAHLDGALRVLKKHLLRVERFKPVCDEGERKCVYLRQDYEPQGDVARVVFERRDISLTYDNWKAAQIIDAVLPPPLAFAGYTAVGRVLHVNLRESLLPYRFLIGQVLYDKTKDCQSVVNKVGIVDQQYRNFTVEVLAGSEDLHTVVRENGCTFEFDFRMVYWNSRLRDEHARVVNCIRSEDTLYDMFCGVGPFAIPGAKKGANVLANDLNPECCRWLEVNKKSNKVPNVIVYNEDAKRFAKVIAQDLAVGESKAHIVMNLPATGYTVIPSFRFVEPEVVNKRTVIVYLYCFVRDDADVCGSGQKLVEDTIGTNLDTDLEDIREVRKVAPSKYMVCVIFRLSARIVKSLRNRNVSENKRRSDHDAEMEVKRICKQSD